MRIAIRVKLAIHSATRILGAYLSVTMRGNCDDWIARWTARMSAQMVVGPLSAVAKNVAGTAAGPRHPGAQAAQNEAAHQVRDGEGHNQHDSRLDQQPGLVRQSAECLHGFLPSIT